MKQFFVTYGCGSDRANNYSLIEAEDIGEANRIAHDGCGRQFAFVYPVEASGENGLAAQKRAYRLTEVPLGPQVRRT